MSTHARRIALSAAAAVAAGWMLFTAGCGVETEHSMPPQAADAHAGHDHPAPDAAAQPQEPPAPSAGAAADQAGAAVKPYPFDTCIVSDGALDAMGGPVVRVYDGQEVKFCCDGCVTIFEKDPAKYLAKIAAATAPKAE